MSSLCTHVKIVMIDLVKPLTRDNLVKHDNPLHQVAIKSMTLFGRHFWPYDASALRLPLVRDVLRSLQIAPPSAAPPPPDPTEGAAPVSADEGPVAAATQFLIREVKQLRDEKEIAARSGGRGGG